MRHAPSIVVYPLLFILFLWNGVLTYSDYILHKSAKETEVTLNYMSDDLNRVCEKVKKADAWLLEEWKDENLTSVIYVTNNVTKPVKNGITN